MSNTNDKFCEGFWSGVVAVFVIAVALGLAISSYILTYNQGYQEAMRKVSEQQVQQKKESK